SRSSLPAPACASRPRCRKRGRTSTGRRYASSRRPPDASTSSCCALCEPGGAGVVQAGAMPTVRFLSDEGDLEVDVPEGGPLVDVCDEHDAPVPFSCRSASCGTCRLDVLEGL